MAGGLATNLTKGTLVGPAGGPATKGASAGPKVKIQAALDAGICSANEPGLCLGNILDLGLGQEYIANYEEFSFTHSSPWSWLPSSEYDEPFPNRRRRNPAARADCTVACMTNKTTIGGLSLFEPAITTCSQGCGVTFDLSLQGGATALCWAGCLVAHGVSVSTGGAIIIAAGRDCWRECEFYNEP